MTLLEMFTDLRWLVLLYFGIGARSLLAGFAGEVITQNAASRCAYSLDCSFGCGLSC